VSCSSSIGTCSSLTLSARREPRIECGTGASQRMSLYTSLCGESRIEAAMAAASCRSSSSYSAVLIDLDLLLSTGDTALTCSTHSAQA